MAELYHGVKCPSKDVIRTETHRRSLNSVAAISRHVNLNRPYTDQSSQRIPSILLKSEGFCVATMHSCRQAVAAMSFLSDSYP
ncbi:MAG: hypothetical protein WCR44_07295 [Verrucomicrobiota bacterium]